MQMNPRTMCQLLNCVQSVSRHHSMHALLDSLTVDLQCCSSTNCTNHVCSDSLLCSLQAGQALSTFVEGSCCRHPTCNMLQSRAERSLKWADNWHRNRATGDATELARVTLSVCAVQLFLLFFGCDEGLPCIAGTEPLNVPNLQARAGPLGLISTFSLNTGPQLTISQSKLQFRYSGCLNMTAMKMPQLSAFKGSGNNCATLCNVSLNICLTYKRSLQFSQGRIVLTIHAQNIMAVCMINTN
jgi:hypothetical protein